MDDGATAAIQVSRTLVEQATRAGVDVAGVTERALRNALHRAMEDMPGEAKAHRLDQVRREIQEEVAWFNDHVERHGLLSDEWRSF